MTLLSKLLLPFGIGAALLLAYIAGDVIYNLFFHPLRKFPGPFSHRATRLGFSYRICTGTIPFDVHALHQKYGNVVRIAPDHLSYTNPQAWQDIMGHHGSKNAEMQKYKNYYRPVPNTPTNLINAEREDHAALRKTMAHAFSERKLREQQPIISGYINLFVKRLKEKGNNGATPLDMVTWYNSCLFDVIGDLAFGEPFGCLENSEYDPWVRSFFGMARTGTMMYGLNWWPRIQAQYMKRLPKETIQEQIQTYVGAIQKVAKRMKVTEERSDFLQGLLEKKDALGIKMEEIESNSSTLVAAGSETTATSLSGLTYHLLRNPDMLARLTKEIRGTYQSDENITVSTVNDLPYLKACVEEILRIYPPTPSGLPRSVPKDGAVVCGEFLPGDTAVSVYHYAMYRSEDNFVLPTEFHPERFLGDPRFAKDSKEAFQPFHIGPRSCLGKNLAYLEMRVIMAKIIFNFDMELASDSQEWMKGQRVFDIWEKPALNVYLKPVSHAET